MSKKYFAVMIVDTRIARVVIGVDDKNMEDDELNDELEENYGYFDWSKVEDDGDIRFDIEEPTQYDIDNCPHYNIEFGRVTPTS